MELAAGDDPRFRGVRRAVLGTAVVSWAASIVVPAIALFHEARPLWQWLGGFGLLILTAAFLAALSAVAAPAEATVAGPSVDVVATGSMAGRPRRLFSAGFTGASLLSILLVAPVGTAHWYTWAWIGGATAGFVPLLWRGPIRWMVAAAFVVIAVAVGAVTGGAPHIHGLIAASVGSMILVTVLLPFRLWTLLLDARAGREARARLAVTQERLRFARDVHDVLGHRLSVIALKAELAARLSGVDPQRSAEEAAAVQRLSAAALVEVREAVHGYRTLDLGDQLLAVEGVLRDAGIRCTVRGTAQQVPGETATQLALTLREGCTNVLRHSAAQWCTIEVHQRPNEVRLTMTNDGARSAVADRLSFGLQGAAERLATVGGELQTGLQEDVFRLEITVPTP